MKNRQYSLCTLNIVRIIVFSPKPLNNFDIVNFIQLCKIRKLNVIKYKQFVQGEPTKESHNKDLNQNQADQLIPSIFHERACFNL